MIQLSLYTQEVITFLRTITIKNTWFADRMKQTYATAHGKDINQVSDYANPYYRQICGIRALDDTSDQLKVPLTVHSGDLDLTIATLYEYPSVRQGLKLPNDVYDNLCRIYPDKADLIKAIVYPILPEDGETFDAAPVCPDELLYSIDNPTGLTDDQLLRMQKAITASHLSLLAYDGSVLESAEVTSIVYTIQTRLRELAARWAVDNFAMESLYPAAFWNAIWLQLFLTIHTTRVKNINPAMVGGTHNDIARSAHLPTHSYHITAFLESRGLSAYTGVLDREQQLFLYQNLNWLYANIGKQSTVEILATHLLQPSGLWLFHKRLVTATTFARTTCKKEPHFLAVNINDALSTQKLLGLSHESLTQILTREADSGLEPLEQEPAIVDEQTRRLSMTPETSYNTPLMTVAQSPRHGAYSNMYVEYVCSSLLHEWNAGRLDNITVNFRVPYYVRTLLLTIDDIIYFMAYLHHRLSGQELGDLPTVFQVRHLVRTSTTYTDVDDEEQTLTAISPEDFDETFRWVGFDIPEDEDDTSDPFSQTVRYDRYLNLTDDADAHLYPYIESQYQATVDPDLGHVYVDMNQFIDELDRRFLHLHQATVHERETSDPLYARAIHTFLNTITARYVFKKTSDQFTTFNEWLAARPTISTLFEYHDAGTSSEATWANLAASFVKTVIPIIVSPWVAIPDLTQYERSRLVELFEQLCSYNIAFLKPPIKGAFHWFVTAPIRYRTSQSKSIGSVRIPERSSIGSRSCMTTAQSRIPFMVGLSVRTDNTSFFSKPVTKTEENLEGTMVDDYVDDVI